MPAPPARMMPLVMSRRSFGVPVSAQADDRASRPTRPSMAAERCHKPARSALCRAPSSSELQGRSGGLDQARYCAANLASIESRDSGGIMPAREITTRDLLRFYETALHSQACHYDLHDRADRRASAEDLALFFFQIVRVNQPKLFIEAGAKDARTSMRARRYLKEAEIVAFEANPYNYARFKDDKKLNHDKISYRNYALSEESGSLTFKIKKKSDGEEVSPVAGDNSMHYRIEKGFVYDEITVPSITLDDYFVDNQNRCCLWVDVEGATKEVLSGANRLLDQTDFLLVEVEDRLVWEGQWLRKELNEYLFHKSFVPVARDFQSRYQYNIIYVKDWMIDFDSFRNIFAYYHSGIGAKTYGQQRKWLEID